MPDNGSDILKAIKSVDEKIVAVDATVREIQLEQAVISTTLTLNEKNLKDKLKAAENECRASGKEAAKEAVEDHVDGRHDVKKMIYITCGIIVIATGVVALINLIIQGAS